MSEPVDIGQLQEVRQRLFDGHHYFGDLVVLSGAVDLTLSLLEAPEVWVCVETTPREVRVSNGPGGPNHCYYTGRTRHLDGCGFKALVPMRLIPVKEKP